MKHPSTSNLAPGRWLAVLLAAAFLAAVPLGAQTAGTAPPRSLRIVILDGEGALNNIQERTAREPIVQVQDENHKPVAGAAVLFAIHGGGSGAGASFAGGASTLSVTTDADGTARAAGLISNKAQGSWQIAVTATVGGLTASMVINELNVLPPSPSPSPESSTTTGVHPGFHWIMSKPVMIAGGVVVAGVVATVVAMEANSGSPTQITPGSPVVGPPAGAHIGVRFHF